MTFHIGQFLCVLVQASKAVKHPDGLGFATLANLLYNFMSVTKLFTNDGLPKTPFTKKNKNKPNNIPPDQSDNFNTIPLRDNYSKF